jgi:hypothetical protein
MNVILDIYGFQLNNIIFLESKRNMIMDGTFAKIIYSNQYFSLNSIYFDFPIELLSIEKQMNKYIMKYNPNSYINNTLIQELTKIEYRIIEYYKQINEINKRTNCILNRQLLTGNLKIYKDYNLSKINKNPPQYIIKISGIWENNNEIGITYKIIEGYEG